MQKYPPWENRSRDLAIQVFGLKTLNKGARQHWCIHCSTVQYSGDQISGYPDIEASKTTIHYLYSRCQIKLDIRSKNIRILKHKVVMIRYPDTRYPDWLNIRTFWIVGYRDTTVHMYGRGMSTAGCTFCIEQNSFF